MASFFRPLEADKHTHQFRQGSTLEQVKHKPFWFSNVDLANDGHLFAENLSSVDHELRRSKEEFIKEHFARYTKPTFPPAWKTLETISFGTLSKLYGNFSRKADKKQVAVDFGVPQHEFMISWLESLTSLRNFCAHHSRIWNRRYAVKPQMPRKMNGGNWLTDYLVVYNNMKGLCW